MNTNASSIQKHINLNLIINPTGIDSSPISKLLISNSLLKRLLHLRHTIRLHKLGQQLKLLDQFRRNSERLQFGDRVHEVGTRAELDPATD